MKIHGLQKLTLLDYPGKVACTVFLAGCNLRCPFCHNSVSLFSPKSSGIRRFGADAVCAGWFSPGEIQKRSSKS